MNNNETFIDELSTWSKNGLVRLYGRDILKEPEVIAGIGIAVLEHAIGLGPKSLQEIAFALFRYGCIDDIDKWLGGNQLYNAEKNNIRWTNRS
jgi:hypothetical protein